jgi:small multidrug resistance family-3 protein
VDHRVVIIVWTFGLFFLASLAEIAGGWMVWQWLREHRSIVFGLMGAVTLTGYGIVATFQPESEFGRIYAGYGGIFVVMAMLWGWRVDSWIPDRWDIAGAAACLAGVALIMFAPRSS